MRFGDFEEDPYADEINRMDAAGSSDEDDGYNLDETSFTSAHPELWKLAALTEETSNSDLIAIREVELKNVILNKPDDENTGVQETTILKYFDSEQDFATSVPKSRYFVDKSDVKCSFCRQTGHDLRNCQLMVVPCHVCKMDHDPANCKISDVCFRCGNIGHKNNECSFNSSGPKKCMYCSMTHQTFECPWAWRQYEFKKNPVVERGYVVSCFVCGSKGHFGDDCPTKFQSSYRVSAYHKDALVIPDWIKAKKSDHNDIESSRSQKSSKKRDRSPTSKKHSSDHTHFDLDTKDNSSSNIHRRSRDSSYYSSNRRRNGSPGAHHRFESRKNHNIEVSSTISDTRPHREKTSEKVSVRKVERVSLGYGSASKSTYIRKL